jgi:hypothetical protein
MVAGLYTIGGVRCSSCVVFFLRKSGEKDNGDAEEFEGLDLDNSNGNWDRRL